MLTVFLKNMYCCIGILLWSLCNTVTAEPRMLGELPQKISWLINTITTKRTKNTSIPYKNRLLLYGPPGNGKTTIAQVFAEQTDAFFIPVAAPTIVGKFVGEGAQRIKTLFEQAHERALHHSFVVLFIDEIDAIASHNATEMRSEHLAALQQLWLELDACKDDPKFFMICATNNIEQLHAAFIDRFGTNLIECTNPDHDMRTKLLEYFFKKCGFEVTISTVEHLAKNTQGSSIRTLEDLVHDIVMTLDTVSPTYNAWHKACTDQLALLQKRNHATSSTQSDPTLWQKAGGILSMLHTSLSIALCVHSLYTIIYSKETNLPKFVIS